MDKRVFILAHAEARARAVQAVKDAPDGYRVEVREPKKRRGQEEKYHAMIGDIARDCLFMQQKWDTETWKRLLIDAFVTVMRNLAFAEGRPDPFDHASAVVPSLDGTSIVQLGVQSRSFSVKQASDFIEYLYSFGAERDVRWTCRSWDCL